MVSGIVFIVAEIVEMKHNCHLRAGVRMTWCAATVQSSGLTSPKVMSNVATIDEA